MKKIKKAPLLLSLLLMLSLIITPNISQVFADDNKINENERTTEEVNTDEVEGKIEESTLGSISGLTWFDKNENGIKESSESIISGISLYLYSTDDKTTVVNQTTSDTNGNYVFDNLSQGSYYVAVRAQAINGTNYLIPIASIQSGNDNKFDADYSIEPIASYSNSISINENDVINVNAGMRKELQVTPLLYGNYNVYDEDTTTDLGNYVSLEQAFSVCNSSSSTNFTVTAKQTDPDQGDEATINSGKTITLTSDGSSAYTIKQITDNNRHIHANGTLILDNIILEGNGNPIDGNKNGGIQVNSDGKLTVEEDATIQSCNWDEGGAIRSYNGTITIEGSILNNNAKSKGGGIYLTGESNKPSTLNIAGNAIIGNNKSQEGGGIYSNWQAIINITGGNITSNTATDEGGGIHFNSGQINMDGGSIDNNSGGNRAGGIKATDGATITLSGGIIDKNNANEGGGLLIQDSNSTLILSGTDITNNTANDNGGGAKIDKS